MLRSASLLLFTHSTTGETVVGIFWGDLEGSELEGTLREGMGTAESHFNFILISLHTWKHEQGNTAPSD